MNKKPLLLSVLAAALSLGLAQRLAAEDSPLEAAVEYREAVMNVLGWNIKAMGAMAKGEVAFDKDRFRALAGELAAASHHDVLAGFPEESDGYEGSDAKSEIWLNWDDFKAKLEDLRGESARLATVAAGGDEAATKEQFQKTAGACKACHKEYRQ